MRRIVGIELSHQRAPLAIREKISFSAEEQLEALEQLKHELPEVFMIATCNRLAVYAYTDDIYPIKKFFARFGDLTPYLSVFEHDCAAFQHLFATAAGLHSQALGEHEILGQIKKAHATAQAVGSMGPVLDEFVRRAIFIGKKVRKETAIGKHPVSLASVSYDILKRIHKDLNKLNVLVLGTGEMSSLMLKIISKKEVHDLYIASRTYERAQSLANMHGGLAVEMDKISEILPKVDIVIGATHAAMPVFGMDDLADLENNLTLIDLGLPRNFNADIKLLENVKLYDLDDIKSLTYESMQKRQLEVPKAYEIIDHEVAEFKYWINTRKISPVISSYYERLDQIRQEELNWALPKLGELDDNQKKIIEHLISRVARKLSGKPIEMLKNFSQEPHLEKNPIETFKELFDL